MTIDYKIVFQLAQDKGCKLYFEWDNPSIHNYNKESEFTAIDQSIIDANPIQCLLELTLIQKQLRDEHKIYVEVIAEGDHPIDGFSATILNHTGDLAGDGYGSQERNYELALLSGIHEALKLIS